MKSAKMLAILVLAFVLMPCLSKVSEAARMGTAFTYKDHLYDDAGNPEDGFYDFQFKLYSDASPSPFFRPLGRMAIDDVNVIDGYFRVELDFGSSVFDGQARWLEIGVRPAELEDPNVYTIRTSRQEIKPTPYALYAKTAGSIPSGVTGSGTANYIAKFTGRNTIGHSVIYEANGKVGIGTSTIPSAELEVLGKVRVRSSKEEFGAALTAINDSYSTNGSHVYGLSGVATGWDGVGVYGVASASSGFGVCGRAEGESGCGVYGSAPKYGGLFSSEAANGSGVSGRASDIGNYTNYGGHFVAYGQTGTGVYGEAWNSKSGSKYGGYFVAKGSSGRGVYGEALATSGTNYGVYGKTNCSESYAGYFVGGRNYFDGNVGIGTTDPKNKLDVQGAVAVGANYSGTQTAPRNGMIVEGNVGIGTTKPYRQLQIKDVMRLEPCNTFPTSPSDGDLCVVGKSGNRHLYCYLNGDWRQLD